MAPGSSLIELRRAALEIFASAMQRVDPFKALHNAVSFAYPILKIFERQFDTTSREIFVLSLGKAAHPMAAGLVDILRDRVSAGLVAGPSGDVPESSVWRVFRGGHPIPNQQSLEAAKAAFELLQRANNDRALMIFLVSGGGSAMMEWPRSAKTTLDDLRQTNQALVSSGATIAEINAVRQAFSAIKGGGLASRAPRATQISLIISDVNPGEEEKVSSGPTICFPSVRSSASEIIDRYSLRSSLPASVLQSIDCFSPQTTNAAFEQTNFVLLDNHSALEGAAEKARSLDFQVEIARDIVEQPIDLGCDLLLTRLKDLRNRTSGQPVCLISGGEFSCPVLGNGLGGRNLETVLRCAMNLERNKPDGSIVVLSSGTDGIDGNSPAAGAIADQETIERGRNAWLEAATFLTSSDSFSFFSQLGDAIITGQTGTNVRDLRILLATNQP